MVKVNISSENHQQTRILPTDEVSTGPMILIAWSVGLSSVWKIREIQRGKRGKLKLTELKMWKLKVKCLVKWMEVEDAEWKYGFFLIFLLISSDNL